MTDYAEKLKEIVEKCKGCTEGEWKLWRGPTYVGGGEDICIGQGDKWLANMDHRQSRCPQILENGHNDDACDICSMDGENISAEQLANAHLIASARTLLTIATAQQAELVRLREENAKLVHEIKFGPPWPAERATP